MDTGRPAGDHSRTDDKSELGGSSEQEEDCSFREASELGFKGSCKIINRKASGSLGTKGASQNPGVRVVVTCL